MPNWQPLIQELILEELFSVSRKQPTPDKKKELGITQAMPNSFESCYFLVR